MFNKLLDYFKNINSYKDLKVKDASNVLKQNNELNKFISQLQHTQFQNESKYRIVKFLLAKELNELTEKNLYCFNCGIQLPLFKVLSNSKFCSSKCSNSSELTKNKSKQTFLNHYGVDNPAKSAKIQNKIKITNVERYGVERPAQNTEIKNKITESCKQTLINKYSVDNISKVDFIKEKKIKKCLEKYGVEYVTQLDSVKEKKKETCLMKYGVEHPSKNELVKNKITESNKQTCLDRYGVDSIFQTNKLKEIGYELSQDKLWKTILSWKDFVKPLFNRNDLEGYSKEYHWKCTKCENKFYSNIHSTNIDLFNQRIPRCLKCYPFLSGTSKKEQELVEFCKQFYPNLIQNDRKLIAPYELDILIPELKLAVEFNGSYWHSLEAGTHLGYHQMKSMMCETKGYRLIHIWEDEWSDTLKIKLKAVLEQKEEINNEKKLDHSWFKFDKKYNLSKPEIILRNGFHVENCGYMFK